MADKFKSLKKGDTAEIFHAITEDDVEKFANLTGDKNPLHLDNEFAASTTLRKRVVHGMLTASFISTIIGTRMPGEGALWCEQNMQFLSPVRIGERIKVVAKIRHKSESQRLLVIETLIFGDDGRKVLTGEAKVKVMEVSRKEEKVSNVKGAVIVTGAGRGIGEAIAKALAADGWPVVVNYHRSRDEAEKVIDDIRKKKGNAVAFQATVSDEKEVANLVSFALSKFKKISAVINNAAPSIKLTAFENLEWDEIQNHLDVQVRGAFNLAQKTLPHFIENKSGTIINIGSIAADDVPPSKQTAYCIAKAALVALTRSLAVEYGPKGIRAICVAPGMTQTDLIADLPEKAKLLTKMETPLRTLAEPADIANVVSFLVSDKAKHMTGSTIRVCGGSVMV